MDKFQSIVIRSMIGVAILTCRCWANPQVPIVAVEGQPLGANVKRVIQTLEYLGNPLPRQLADDLKAAATKRDWQKLQQLLDPQVLATVTINPELRVKVKRGNADARLQQAGFTPFVVKVINEGVFKSRLRIVSPHAGPVYSGPALAILKRQAQTELKVNENRSEDPDRFLEVEMFQRPPMTEHLSGLSVEYVIALIYCSESGKRDATIGFDIGAGNQDLGFRGEVPILFDVARAIPVKLAVLDHDGVPTTARLTIRDADGHVYPPQAKRLAPDFFFQPQIYRRNDDVLLLPPGRFTVEYSRGPEYVVKSQNIEIGEGRDNVMNLRLQRWINPRKFGFYCGDHHIHGAGCSHYNSPTQGVRPEDMFLQVKGEGLNVGCVLTWGPCFDHQRQYFSPVAATISEDLSILKYDLEISGFGSAALGHVCLLNLKDQSYPGSGETKDKGWPTWTVPVLRWTKQQGGFTGYPHSAFDIDPRTSAEELIRLLDANADGRISPQESDHDLLPDRFASIDEDGNQMLSESEVRTCVKRVANQIPNVALPDMNGGGALEICVSTAEGVCDFVSAMDTPRVSEWNTWYHIMNCGFPLKLSGETDFPCMSSRQVGQGRVYVQLGDIAEIDFAKWCQGLAEGRSYVGDGYAHALEFAVNGVAPGTRNVDLKSAMTVQIRSKVAFASEMPQAVAYGNLEPKAGRWLVGDTVNLHAPRSTKTIKGGQRLMEVVVNGKVADSKLVPADGNVHELEFDVGVTQSSWIAIRHFPQLHTNPVNVIVNDQPIRASRKSALWCAETVKLLWKNRSRVISIEERPAAHEAYQRAIKKYEDIAAECAPKS